MKRLPSLTSTDAFAAAQESKSRANVTLKVSARMYDEGLLQRCMDCLSGMAGAGVHHKNVFGMRGLMRGKQMFAAVGESSIIVKMTTAEFVHALAQPGVTRFMPGGQTLGTWVEIQDDAIADDPELREWLAAGLRAI